MYLKPLKCTLDGGKCHIVYILPITKKKKNLVLCGPNGKFCGSERRELVDQSGWWREGPAGGGPSPALESGHLGEQVRGGEGVGRAHSRASHRGQTRIGRQKPLAGGQGGARSSSRPPSGPADQSQSACSTDRRRAHCDTSPVRRVA